MADDKENTNAKPQGTGDLSALTDREDNRPSATERANASLDAQADQREALAEPAHIKPAKPGDIEASGSIVEPSVKSDIDVDHPAVDNNPRAGTTVRQNSIDFNDPTLTSRQAVTENLNKQ